MTCELAEGIEGIVYGNELTWGDEEERAETLKSLSPGQTVPALVAKLERHRRRALLSFKRAQVTETGTLFDKLRGTSFQVEVASIQATGALVKLPGMDDAKGFLPANEIFCGVYRGGPHQLDS